MIDANMYLPTLARRGDRSGVKWLHTAGMQHVKRAGWIKVTADRNLHRWQQPRECGEKWIELEMGSVCLQIWMNWLAWWKKKNVFVLSMQCIRGQLNLNHGWCFPTPSWTKDSRVIFCPDWVNFSLKKKEGRGFPRASRAATRDFPRA